MKIFERLEKYKLRLNPKKFVFGVTSGKLLEFIVSCRCIEVDPAKVKAIMKMHPLRYSDKFATSKGNSSQSVDSLHIWKTSIIHLHTSHAKIPNSNGTAYVRRLLRNSKNTKHHL